MFDESLRPFVRRAAATVVWQWSPISRMLEMGPLANERSSRVRLQISLKMRRAQGADSRPVAAR